MRWRTDVTIEWGDATWLCRGNKKKKVKKEDEKIVELIESGITDDDELLEKVSEQMETDDISAGFSLAQFVEDYGDFIAEGERAAVFGT